MKRNLFFILLIGIAFTSCKKDSKDTTVANTGQFPINGTTYKFTDMLWSDNGTSTIYYRIESFDLGNNEIVIQIPNKTVGDYNFSDPKVDMTDVSVDLTIGSDIYNSVTGTGKVTITKSDNNVVVGTFTGKFTNKTVTVDASGSFTANKFSVTL